MGHRQRQDTCGPRCVQCQKEWFSSDSWSSRESQKVEQIRWFKHCTPDKKPWKLFMRVRRGRRSVGVWDRILFRARNNVWVIARGRTQAALDMSNLKKKWVSCDSWSSRESQNVAKMTWFKHCSPDEKSSKPLHANNTKAEERRFLSSHSEHSKRWCLDYL